MRKRIIALLLAVIICAGLQPEPVLASGGEAVRAAISGILKTNSTVTMHFPNSYNWHFEVPLLNSRTMNDRTFLNNYVYKDKSEFTATKAFKLYDYSRVDMNSPESNLYLAYNNEYYTFNDLASWFAQYRWNVNSGPNWNFQRLVKEGQISFLYSAELRYSRHMHWKKPGWHNRLRDYAQAIFFYGYNESNQIAMLMNNENQSESWNSMSTGWRSMPTYAADNVMNILLTHDERGNCLCGASSVRRSVLVFADTVAPSITSLSVANKQYYYNEGTIEFTVNFNEPIRRSDGVIGDDRSFNTEDKSFWVRLAAYDRETRQSVTNAYAKLKKANESSLVFEYTVPDGVDIIITGLAGADMQKDCILEQGGTFKMITNSGSYMNVSGNGGVIKATATFTDFAGNGINEKWRAVSFPQEIHVDTKTPVITTMAIPSGSMMLGQDTTNLPDGWNSKNEGDEGWADSDIDRSQVFAGTGDWLNLYVDFSEELKDLGGSGALKSSNAGKFIATLNILKGDGTPVTLRGASAESVKLNINNNIPVTRLTFETLHITEDMRPVDDGRPIRITQIGVDGGYTVNDITDMCGNKIDVATVTNITVVPEQQEWLDTNAPTVMIGYQGQEENGIKIRINVTENSYSNVSSGNRTRYNSGVTGVGEDGTGAAARAGTIRLTGMPDEEYEWAITLDETAPETWTTSRGDTNMKFQQLGQLVYLHLRLKGVPEMPLTGFNVTCTGLDWAGNETTATSEIKVPGGNLSDILIKETVMPTSDARFDTKVNSVIGGKAVSATFTASDKGGLAEVKYNYSVKNSPYTIDEDTVLVADREKLIEQAQGGTDGWVSVPLDGNKTSVEMTTETVNCLPGNDNYVCLYIYVKDKSGNETVYSYKFHQDMRLPRFSVTIPEDNVVTATQKLGVGLLNVDDAKEMGPVRMTQLGGWSLSYGALFITLIPKQIEDYGVSLGRSEDQYRGITALVDELLDEGGYSEETGFPSVEERKPVRNDELFKDIDDVIENLEIINGAVDASKFMEELNNINTLGLITPKGYLRYGRYSYPEEPTGYNVLFMVTSEEQNDLQEDLDVTQNIINVLKSGYYGEMEVAFTEVDGQLYSYSAAYGASQGSVNEDRRPIYSESYTVKVRMDDHTDKNYNTLKFQDIIAPNGEVIQNIGVDSWELDGRINKILQYPRKGEAAQAFKTLEGLKIPFTVANNRIEKWGVEDIDFEKSHIDVYYAEASYENGENSPFNGEFTKIATSKLVSGSAEQCYIFPDKIDGEDYRDGVYKITVTLVVKSFGKEETFDISADDESYGWNGCILKLCTMEPDPNGGVMSVFLVDGTTLSNSTGLSYRRFGEYMTENGNDGSPVTSFALPMIKSISADGSTTDTDYFFAFLTYQNNCKMKGGKCKPELWRCASSL